MPTMSTVVFANEQVEIGPALCRIACRRGLIRLPVLTSRRACNLAELFVAYPRVVHSLEIHLNLCCANNGINFRLW